MGRQAMTSTAPLSWIARSRIRTSSASSSRPTRERALPTSSRSSATSWPRWSATSTPSSTGWRSIISTPGIRTPTSSFAAGTTGQGPGHGPRHIGHGVRARAQSLITLELGPESEVERIQKLFNEVGQERLTRLDRSLMARTKDGILVVTSEQEQDPVQRTLRVGRLKTLERLGLAEERQQGVLGARRQESRPSCASSATAPTSSR